MSGANVVETWFNPPPLEEYGALVKDSASNIPETCPKSDPIGTPAIDVKCGPILRLLATLEDGSDNYRATALVVTLDESSDYSASPSIKYYIGPSKSSSVDDLKSSLTSGTFPVTKFHGEQGHSFWRFEINLSLRSYEQKVVYLLNGHESPNYRFFLPALEQSMNIMSHSCNGFSLGTDTSIFKGSMWYDVMKKHDEHPYHVMLGGGDQLYADGIKKSSKEFEKWLKHKHIYSSEPLTDKMVCSFENYYLNLYLNWFGKGFWKGTNGKTLQLVFPLAMQQIPSINIFDDHDIIDGFGSYSDRTMGQLVFQGVGNSAFKYYMLFQHHTSLEEKAYTDERSWILGAKPGPFIKQKSHSVYARLGKEIGFLGFDCRTERKQNRIICPETYDLIFDRAQHEIDASNGNIKHLLILLGVPIAYPRLVWVEYLLTSRILGPIKLMARKGIILRGLVNEFDGGIELLDDLNDHWCATHHKRERNRLVSRLTNLGAENGVRITILSGDVHLCCIGRLKTKLHHYHKPEEAEALENNPEKDARLIFNIISSAICNTPPPDGMAKLLLWRNKVHQFDRTTDENTVPMFTAEPDGTDRENYHFMNRRNWCDLIPMKESTKYVNNPDYEVGDYILPGPAFKAKGKQLDDTFDKYPIEANSLVVTLHVEKDSKNVNSETVDYELLVPSLLHKETLTHDGVKI